MSSLVQCHAKKLQIMQANDKKYNKFKYVVVSNKKTSACYSFAFNRNATIFFVGQWLWDNSHIIAYGFNNRQKIIQSLHNHKESVNYLIFLKKSNQLVSACMDNSITIWSSTSLWKPDQKLLGHTSFINCMITNEDEDLLISGSCDKHIIFWQKSNVWVCQQRLDTNFNASCLSLNSQQTKLISCDNSIIKVIELQPDQQWLITQKINVEQCEGFGLCFIDVDQFILQEQRFLEIYKYDEEKQQFAKTKQVQVQNCEKRHYYYSCQFIKSENILVTKYGMNVNLFKRVNQQDFVHQQLIEFDNQKYDKLTYDGQFFTTYDHLSGLFQVRKLLRLE